MQNTLSLLVFAGLTAACVSVTAQYTAKDFTTPSYVQFSAPRFEVSETETNAVVTVVRSGDFRKPAAVEYSTREGTAASNIDFQPCGGTLVFAAGQSFKTITIPIIRENQTCAKTFLVDLTEKGPETIVTTPSAEIEIKALPPALDISIKNGIFFVTWPDAGQPFKLESQIDGAWSAVSNSPALFEGRWTAKLEAIAPITFFRLRLDAGN